MPVRSKWQSLPTEAINPSTLAIDKLSAADIVRESMKIAAEICIFTNDRLTLEEL